MNMCVLSCHLHEILPFHVWKSFQNPNGKECQSDAQTQRNSFRCRPLRHSIAGGLIRMACSLLLRQVEVSCDILLLCMHLLFVNRLSVVVCDGRLLAKRAKAIYLLMVTRFWMVSSKDARGVRILVLVSLCCHSRIAGWYICVLIPGGTIGYPPNPE